jgi:tetratricopeptide (TPR) repeat protein
MALPFYEELGDLSGQAAVLTNLGVEAYYEGDWEKALDLYERSRKLRERLGDVTNVARQMSNIGEIRSDQGHLDEAELLFHQVVRICDTAGERRLATVARSNLGRAAARAGRFDEAEERLEGALKTFGEMHAGGALLETEARLAELDVLRGDRPQIGIERATDVLEHFDAAAVTAPLRAAVLRIRAVARLQFGDVDGAHADLEQSRQVAESADAAYELALTLDLSSKIHGREDEAEGAAALFAVLDVEHVVRPPLDGRTT